MAVQLPRVVAFRASLQRARRRAEEEGMSPISSFELTCAMAALLTVAAITFGALHALFHADLEEPEVTV
jgi:hypothetical protein